MKEESDSNVGELGVESIQLLGVKVEKLPWFVSVRLSDQMKLAHDTERKNKIANILAQYPRQGVDYLVARIEEAAQNAGRIRAMKVDQQKMISEYSGLISLCGHRDKELAKTDDPSEIKRLKNQFPPYNLEAMHSQIKQCTEAIERCDGVIAQEYSSIADMREVLALCRKRDDDLRILGVKIA